MLGGCGSSSFDLESRRQKRADSKTERYSRKERSAQLEVTSSAVCGNVVGWEVEVQNVVVMEVMMTVPDPDRWIGGGAILNRDRVEATTSRTDSLVDYIKIFRVFNPLFGDEMKEAARIMGFCARLKINKAFRCWLCVIESRIHVSEGAGGPAGMHWVGSPLLNGFVLVLY